jgi:hypothetical protein
LRGQRRFDVHQGRDRAEKCQPPIRHGFMIMDLRYKLPDVQTSYTPAGADYMATAIEHRRSLGV